MCNRIGILINEANIPKLLEENKVCKERCLQIYENPTEDPVIAKKLKLLDPSQLDSKVKGARISKNLLKQALSKRYHKPLADKIIE